MNTPTRRDVLKGATAVAVMPLPRAARASDDLLWDAVGMAGLPAYWQLIRIDPDGWPGHHAM